MLSVAVWLTPVCMCGAQSSNVPYAHDGHFVSRPLGQEQFVGESSGAYFQPVQISAPEGVLIAPAAGGSFGPAQGAPLTVGLLLGHAYRFEVTGIPRNEGLYVFPTIQLVDRLHPPPGEEIRFPIPIDLTLEELEMALAGKMVTRVIYLEPPHTALPFRHDPTQQRYFEVLPAEDPLKVARQLGRPLAILHMGSRFPDPNTVDEAFMYGSPPLEQYPARSTVR